MWHFTRVTYTQTRCDALRPSTTPPVLSVQHQLLDHYLAALASKRGPAAVGYPRAVALRHYFLGVVEYGTAVAMWGGGKWVSMNTMQHLRMCTTYSVLISQPIILRCKYIAQIFF